MSRARVIAFVVAAALSGVAAAAQSITSGEKLHVTAFAVNLSNFAGATTATVDLAIDRWTTEAERERLVTTLAEKGPRAVLSELQDMPSHGHMRFNAGLGWDLRYAWQTSLPEGGRRIVLATDRYINFWEVRSGSRTLDYPFTVIELRVNKEGEGEGKLSVATRITSDTAGKTITLENWANEPVRLQNVRVKARS